MGCRDRRRQDQRALRTKLTLLPAEVGTARTTDLPIAIEPPSGTATGHIDWKRRTYDFSAHGTRLLIPFGRSANRPPSVHLYDLPSASMKQITPGRVTGPAVLSPDGREVAVNGLEQITVYPVDGGDPRPLAGGETWQGGPLDPGGRAVLVVELESHSARLFRREIKTGERMLIRDQSPGASTGMRSKRASC